MRVLDLQDSDQLKEFIRKEGCTSMDELKHKRGWSGNMSVASSLAYSVGTDGKSLAYSTDGESALEGTKLLQTIAGQPSDSYAFDGGSAVEDEKLDLLFAPAAPAIVKKTKGNKVVLGKDKTSKKRNSSSTKSSTKDNVYGTPEQKSHRRYSPSPTSSSKSTPTKSPPSDPGTPPLPKRKQFIDGVLMEEEDDVWYKEWWMSCFPDAFKNLMPKR